MRTFLYLITLVFVIPFFNYQLLGQSPESINYQAVARDGSGNILMSTSLDVRIGIYSGVGGAAKEYEETHSVSTNDFGLFSIAIGNGSPTSGTFSAIAWGSDEHWVQVEVDDGSGFVNLGKTQLVSVPYALFAKAGGTSYSAGSGLSLAGTTFNALNTSAMWNADQIQGRNVSTTAPSNNEVLKWNGTAWAPAVDATGGGGGSVWSTNGADAYYNTGNVGIGTTTPNLGKLEIKGTGPYGASVIFDNGSQRWAVGNNGAGFRIIKIHGSTFEALKMNDDGEMELSNDINLIGPNRFITIDNTDAADPSGFRFYKNGSFQLGLFYEPDENILNISRSTNFDRIVLDANNNVVIGGPTGDNNAALTVDGGFNNGRIKFGSQEYQEDGGFNEIAFNASLRPTVDDVRDLGSAVFRWDDVYASSGTVNTSDRRDKENIQSSKYGLAEVMQMKPVTYQFEKPYGLGDKKIGLIAQDLQQLVPEVVKSHDMVQREDGSYEEVELDRLGVYYSDLIPVLVKAIQEQQAEIDLLKEQLQQR